METSPTQPKQRSKTFKTVAILSSVVILLGGVAQIWSGVKRLRSGNSAEFTQMVQESDSALAEARRYATEARPRFQQMMKDVDALGLEAFRAQQKEAAAHIVDLLRNSSEQFRLAEKKLADSKPLNRNDRLTPFLEHKARSYGLFAQTVDINQEMAELVMDESITSVDALLPRLTDANARYQAIENDAKAEGSQADAIGEQLQSKAKK